MTDLPHVIAGQPMAPKLAEELTRIVEAYQQVHDTPVVGTRLNVELCNAAIDWWNGLGADDQEGGDDD